MNERKAIFFTSDWHVGHANVLEFDKRPFTDLEHMHRVLINNFNASVSSAAITYFLGDMGLCSSSVLRNVVAQLNGTKVLVLGNHDSGVNSMYAVGFHAVLNSASFYVAQTRVTASHCPLQGVAREDITGMRGAKEGEAWHGESRQGRFSITNEGQYHLHGHVHSPNGGRSKKILGKQYDVGVVANGYRPVSISQIERWIALTNKI